MSKKAPIKVLYNVEVRDKNGDLIHKQQGESRSLLKNFMQWLRGFFKTGPIGAVHPSDIPVVDTGGVTRNIWTDSTTITYANKDASYVGSFNAPDDNDSFGILVGSGDVAVTPDDYQLASKIAHGTGTNQLDYGTHTVEDVAVDGNTVSFRFSRTFTNLSGASVTVKELGITLQCWATGDTTINVLILRDVLSSPVSVPDGATLTVRYTFQVTA